jgi:hypothetical protein
MMCALRDFARYGYVPFMLIGVNGIALLAATKDIPLFAVGGLGASFAN